MQTITLSGGAIAPLRTGLYSRLATLSDRLSAACEHPDREGSRDTAEAYLALLPCGTLLCRAGWDHAAESVHLFDAVDRQTAIEALAVACEAFADRAGDARRHGDDHAADMAGMQALACRDALAAIEAGCGYPEPVSEQTLSFDGEDAALIREALREHMTDVASHLESAMQEQPQRSRDALLAALEAGGAVEAAGWTDGPLSIDPDVHSRVILAALAAQDGSLHDMLADIEKAGGDTQAMQARLDTCARLIETFGGGDA
jgi:hypothetical protein